MPSQKALNGVAHNIMDHAVSGLSYLQPHLCEAARASGQSVVVLDLTDVSPVPKELSHVQPLKLASEAVHRRFVQILGKCGFSIEDVSFATLTFVVPEDTPDDPYRYACVSELGSEQGRKYRHEMHTDTYYAR